MIRYLFEDHQRNIHHLAIAAKLHCLGFSIDLGRINGRGVSLDNAKILVGLPAYTFKYSRKHWAESRLSKNFRFKQFPWHEVLGASVNDCDPSEAMCRNFTGANENPWIPDHKVTGASIYQGAGMVVIAIEASRQLAKHGRQIKDYRLHEICFSKALVIPLTSDGAETYVFRVCSYENDE